MKTVTNDLSAQWQPDELLIEQIAMHNIPCKFTKNCVAGFHEALHDNVQNTLSLRSRFIKHVIQQWRQRLVASVNHSITNSPVCVSSHGSRMQLDWKPNNNTLTILNETLCVNRSFVEDAIPEFVLYWNERGESLSTWNSKFILHVKHQWLRYKASLEKTNEPSPISPHWQPSQELLDVLRMANIDADFALGKLPEFILYWTEAGHTYPSWNTKFLQHVKFHWSKQAQFSRNHKLSGKHSDRIFPNNAQRTVRSTRDISLYEQLTDRSWADGILLK